MGRVKEKKPEPPTIEEMVKRCAVKTLQVTRVFGVEGEYLLTEGGRGVRFTFSIRDSDDVWRKAEYTLESPQVVIGGEQYMKLRPYWIAQQAIERLIGRMEVD
jgi:hypothetical protein